MSSESRSLIGQDALSYSEDEDSRADWPRRTRCTAARFLRVKVKESAECDCNDDTHTKKKQ